MASPVTSGQVILLTGASSSGKTSIAAELQEVMHRPWFHLPVDAHQGPVRTAARPASRVVLGIPAPTRRNGSPARAVC